MERQLHDIHFRPIRPEDRRRLQRFHHRLSTTTVAQRFHAAKAELTEPLARRFTELDTDAEAAIVATTGTRGRIIGVARYSKLDPHSAEVAFVVEDAYQRRGIGRRLMQRLVELARQDGIDRFIAYVLPGNEPMVRLLKEAGATTTHFDGQVFEVVVDLKHQISDDRPARIGPASDTPIPHSKA